MSIDHFDIVIIGAGLSGIGAGYRLQTRCPRKRYIIFEARADMGGTWDLFRFPGVRSDSDMFTLGYPFRPWKGSRAIVDGPTILNYLRETAHEFGIDRHIRFQHRVLSASWSSEDARWRLEIKTGANGETVQCTCDFLYGCTGYYRTMPGTSPAFPAPIVSVAKSFIRSIGLKIWTTPARKLWSSAAEPPRSRWFQPWPARRRTSPCCNARPRTS